jgi:hypothetical protein
MTPSPVKRYRREKSRNRALDDGHRTKLREQALQYAEKGLNRRGGPVDKGSPAEQKKAAQHMRNEQAQALGEKQHQKQIESRKPQTDQVENRRSFQLHKNTTGNARSGQLFRTIPRKGGEIHEYQSGKRVFVRKDSDGTGNRGLKPTSTGGSTAKQMISELAQRRSSENKPKAKRKLFRRAA